MGKILSIAVGAAVIIAGILLMFRWIDPFKMFIKGTLPALLIFGGTIALMAGISEFQDTLKIKEKK
ncbi:MAG: hypothetical protein HQL28_07255 [Candidatus Omnitrophica bacterium]|nr:hypothetical protein [Candidatus Omnitrophota bacterium]